MIFEHILIGGLLLVTACAATTPNIATLEVLPNFDQGLTYKDFRVIYPGFQEGGSDVTIKIYEGEKEDVFHEFKVPQEDVKTQKAYYFGLDKAESGEYKVQVCNGNSCSGKTSSLSLIPKGKGKVRCAKGIIDEVTGKWQKKDSEDLVLDITNFGKWLTKDNIEKIETAMNNGESDESTTYTEWRKYKISSNPGYANGVLYAGYNYDMLPYKDMFLTAEIAKKTGQTKPDNLYVNEFCERKYLLSSHVHLMEKDSKEVKYRFKKTLYMSEKGKQHFIINNDKTKGHLVHVETAFPDAKIASGSYLIWVSLCTTEKDVVDSTMCSDPVVVDTVLVV